MLLRNDLAAIEMLRMQRGIKMRRVQRGSSLAQAGVTGLAPTWMVKDPDDGILLARHRDLRKTNAISYDIM